jgi:MOSC domain-containing protein YiiM
VHQRDESVGRLEAIWIKRAHRGVMEAVEEGRLVEGQGLAGSVDRSRRRQVTLLEREIWERVMSELDAAADPSARRANLLLVGVALANTRGRILSIGDAMVVIGGETTPCERMEAVHPGLRKALAPEWGGGAFAQVMKGATIRVGDPVTWQG